MSGVERSRLGLAVMGVSGVGGGAPLLCLVLWPVVLRSVVLIAHVTPGHGRDGGGGEGGSGDARPSAMGQLRTQEDRAEKKMD